jgi:hypothetical protein
MNGRAFKAAGAAQRADGTDAAARAAKVRRSAWLLTGLAVFVYLGYIAWIFVHGSSGG